MKAAIASDHRGYKLKEEVKVGLEKSGLEVQDCGTYSEESCDYPDFARKALERFMKKEATFVFLICGSGIGMSIYANKFPGVRAALCLNAEMAQMAREHNDANVLVLSSIFTSASELTKILHNWLESSFQGGRHERRVAKIRQLEETDAL